MIKKIINYFKERKKKRSKYLFTAVLKEFKEFGDNYFIIIDESDENGLKIKIASKEQRKKIKELEKNEN